MKTTKQPTEQPHHGRCLLYISVLVSFLIALIVILSVQTSSPVIHSSREHLPPRHLLSNQSSVNLSIHHIATNLTALDINESLITPLLDPNHHRIALQRLHDGNGQIVLFHARKAGGTTMSSWMEQLGRTIPGTQFERLEAFPGWNGKQKERDDVYPNVR